MNNKKKLDIAVQVFRWQCLKKGSKAFFEEMGDAARELGIDEKEMFEFAWDVSSLDA